MKENKTKLWTELNYLFKRQDDIYRHIACEYGFSDSAFDTLYALWDIGDGCTQKEISGLYYIKKQTLNSSVKSLEKEGILHLEDGRGKNKRVFLTEKGRNIVENKIVPVFKAEQKALLGLSEEEQNQLLKTFSKYNDRLEEAIEAMFNNFKEENS